MNADEEANLREQQIRWLLEAQRNASDYELHICRAPTGWSAADPGPRFFPIDPKKKLSDTAARLLSVNHLLRDQ